MTRNPTKKMFLALKWCRLKYFCENMYQKTPFYQIRYFVNQDPE